MCYHYRLYRCHRYLQQKQRNELKTNISKQKQFMIFCCCSLFVVVVVFMQKLFNVRYFKMSYFCVLTRTTTKKNIETFDTGFKNNSQLCSVLSPFILPSCLYVTLIYKQPLMHVTFFI